jgi:hypothetical protein
MLGKFKGLLIQEGIEVAPPVTPKDSATLPKVFDRAVSAPDDPQIVQALQEALQAKTLDGYDYQKFLEAQKALEPVIADEATRFKAVFATIPKSFGVTKQKLIDTAKHYIAVIETEEQAFVEAQTKDKDKVNSTQKRVGDLDSLIAAKAAEIEKLNTEKKGLVTQVTDWKNLLETSKVSFESVSNKMQAKIEQDIKKLSEYLG